MAWRSASHALTPPTFLVAQLGQSFLDGGGNGAIFVGLGKRSGTLATDERVVGLGGDVLTGSVGRSGEWRVHPTKWRAETLKWSRRMEA